VYSRVAEPFNSIFINNRLNTNSLVEPITNQIQLQQQAPFLLYRNERSAISGFWFLCKEDCVRIHGLLEKLIMKCNRPADSNDSDEQSAQQQNIPRNQNGNGGNGNVDIFSMLSKAQEDFNNSSVGDKPTPLKLNQQFAGMQLNQQPPQVPHQPLMKQISSTMPDITSNVVNFFAAAQQPNGKPDGAHFMHPKAPPVQTLDEIEKQHRVSASPPQSIGKTTLLLKSSNC
jgi:mRNA-decapping enzyme 1B